MKPNFQMSDQSRSDFQDSSKKLYQMYKESQKAVRAAYCQGKEDAYEEILKYLMAFSTNYTFRSIPVGEFTSYLQSKYE